MSAQCNSCNNPIVNSEFITCAGICCKPFHIKCVAVDKNMLKAVNNCPNIHWYCHQCNDGNRNIAQGLTSDLLQLMRNQLENISTGNIVRNGSDDSTKVTSNDTVQSKKEMDDNVEISIGGSEVPTSSQAVDTVRQEPQKVVRETGSTFMGKMCFSMSLSNNVGPEKLKDQILHLKGTVCEEQLAFDLSCTHHICSKPVQSEKTLSVIASGRWLLCPAYIEDSFKAGYFLNEELYEWGNPKAEPKLPVNQDVKSNKIAMVGHKWRKELQLRSKQENKPVGIFSGFRVILHAHRKDSFKRLLEAGCGVVVDIKEPYCEQKELQGVTHCLVDKRIKAMSDADKIGLEKFGIHCVNLMYLQTCLLEDTLNLEH